MNRPPATGGMRHVAFYVLKFEACEHFYTELLGMAVEWRPDADSAYLCSGNDNLALHRATFHSRQKGNILIISVLFFGKLKMLMHGMTFLLRTMLKCVPSRVHIAMAQGVFIVSILMETRCK